MFRTLILTATLLFLTAPATAFERDGRRFDPGATMTKRAEGAPEQLDEVTDLVGQWDVTFEVWIGDSLATSADGVAEITFMNRGHGLYERFHCKEAVENGAELNTTSFLVYNEANSLWGLGVANDYTESVELFSGGLEGDDLVLHNALRRLGGLRLTHHRLTITDPSDDGFTMRFDASTDHGETWATQTVRTYRRRTPVDDFMAGDSTYGTPADDVPEEARQFDFFVGEFAESHDMTFPNGQNVQFPQNGTAVYTLNGRGVMEFSWMDLDPNLPDAATSIIRVYNRQMRRWECLYTTNRFNGLLYFGGAKEGDRIVLHQFDATAADSPISEWIFHDIGTDSYKWHANVSRDRGETWQKTWIIEATRKSE